MEISRPSTEDCLFLNIWTPSVDHFQRRPVLVWLHGGGFVMGSGNSHICDGERIVRRGDVVLVTVTHRLNLFGHLALEHLLGRDFADSGNIGMLDIVLSLEWVRDNIAAFGGDPGNVTIFGQSGGGAKVHTLMAMPAAVGLYHRASIQSGGGGRATLQADAARQTRQLLNTLELQPSEASKLLTLPHGLLVDAFTRTFASQRFQGAGPVIDGRTLTSHPFHSEAPAISAEIPLLVGATRTEATVLLGGFFPELFDIRWDELEARLAPVLGGWGAFDTIPAIAARPDHVISTMRANMPNARPSDVFFTAASHSMFIRGAIRTAEVKALQKRGNAYLWSLDWATPLDGGKWGSPHGLDVPMFFDTVRNAMSLVGPNPTEPQIIAEQMSNALIAFARNGDPNHSGLPHWSPYDAHHRAAMSFNDQPSAENDPRAWMRQLFAA